MIVGKILSHNTFDIFDLEETASSIYRSPDMVRLSYKDENNRLVQYVKTTATPMQMSKGDLLVTFNDVLMPTADRHSLRTVGKLLADPSQASETKDITIGFTTYSAYLLPVQLI